MAQERAEYQPTNEQFFEAHDVIGLLMGFKNPGPDPGASRENAPESQGPSISVSERRRPGIECAALRTDCRGPLWRDLAMREKILAYQSTWPKERRELFQRRMACRHTSGVAVSRPEPQTATDLLAEAIPPPAPIVDNLIHEGMLLLGGKSKRGKSWLMLDLALSVATGKRVWGHFPVDEPQPVLYLALEDGKARIQRRLRAIQPDLSAADNLHLLYDFPLLTDGGIEGLRHHIETRHFRLIVIDVLAKVEPAAQGQQ